MLQYEPGLAIWTLITFLLLLLLLAKTAWPKILSMIEERETRLRESLKEAERNKEEAERIKVEYKEMIDKARKETADIIRQGTESAEKIREEMIDKAREDAEVIIKKAHHEIDLEREKAIQVMKNKAVELSITAAARIITSSLTREKQEELARKAIKEMENN